MNVHPLKIGDTAESITVEFERAGELVDLAAATLIQLRYKVGNTLTTRTMTKHADRGKAYYQWTNADFAIITTPGTYAVDFKITWPSGATYPPTVGNDLIRAELPLS